MQANAPYLESRLLLNDQNLVSLLYVKYGYRREHIFRTLKLAVSTVLIFFMVFSHCLAIVPLFLSLEVASVFHFKTFPLDTIFCNRVLFIPSEGGGGRRLLVRRSVIIKFAHTRVIHKTYFI